MHVIIHILLAEHFQLSQYSDSGHSHNDCMHWRFALHSIEDLHEFPTDCSKIQNKLNVLCIYEGSGAKLYLK